MLSQPLRSRIRLLLENETGRVRLPWDSRFNGTTLADHLRLHPEMAFWSPGTGEYIVGGYWRGRHDIGLILETHGGGTREQLLDSILAQFRRKGMSLAVLSQDEVEASSPWYQDRGWGVIDRLHVYRLVLTHAKQTQSRRLDISSFRPEHLADVIAVDHAAFPWLWQHEPSDFLTYSTAPNVTALVGRAGSKLIGYVSYSVRKERGHLDRLAVHPRFAGKGYGSFLLSYALAGMRDSGVAQVGLTTQQANHSAQQLYQLHGFARTGEIHDIYGLSLADAR